MGTENIAHTVWVNGNTQVEVFCSLSSCISLQLSLYRCSQLHTSLPLDCGSVKQSPWNFPWPISHLWTSLKREVGHRKKNKNQNGGALPSCAYQISFYFLKPTINFSLDFPCFTLLSGNYSLHFSQIIQNDFMPCRFLNAYYFLADFPPYLLYKTNHVIRALKILALKSSFLPFPYKWECYHFLNLSCAE